jgi:hypothetical protein
MAFGASSSYAQCAYSGTNYGNVTPAGVGATFTQMFVWGGDHYSLNVVAGSVYRVSFCAAEGGVAAFDTQITVFNSALQVAAGGYNDDFCGAGSQVEFTATETATWTIQVNAFFCGVNFGPNATMVVRYVSQAGLPDEGCTNPLALNYDPAAITDDGSCIVPDCVAAPVQWSYCYPNGDNTTFIWSPTNAGDNITIEFLQGSIESNFWDDIIIQDGPGGAVLYANGGVTTNLAGLIVQTLSGNGLVITITSDSSASCGSGSFLPFIADVYCGTEAVPGCTNPAASNYDPAATIDDGSCVLCADVFTNLTVTGGFFPIEVSWNVTDGTNTVIASGGPGSFDLCLPNNTCYVFNMFDLFGDGWNGATYTFSGGITATGDLNTATTGDGTDFGQEVFSVGTGCVLGCTDPAACNFDALADFNFGCDFVTCGGCTDPFATNYDPSATFDDGSCIVCGAGEILLFIDMTDTFGDGWDGSIWSIVTTGGTFIDSGDLDTAADGDGGSIGTDAVCLAPGCYFFNVSGGFFTGEIGWSLTDQLGNFYGDAVAPNGATTNFPIDFGFTGICDFEGCTNPIAVNFLPSATIDDGSCLLPPANNDVCDAEGITCGLSASGTTEFATDNEGLIGTFCGTPNITSPGVWYEFNAAADQQVTASTCTSLGGDTKIHVFVGAPDCSNLVCIGGNDDGCGLGSLLSSITFTAQTGFNYFILVTEFGVGTGIDFTLTLDCQACDALPTNDDCVDALPQVSGVPFTGSTCCSNPSDAPNFAAGFGTAYDQFFVFNSSDYDTFDFEVVNTGGTNVGLMIYDGDCNSLDDIAGCIVAGTCAGSIEAFLTLTPNTDYYFAVFTTDAAGCGDYTFTTTGINLGCTDPTANNFDAQANQDDGTCDYTGVTQANDDCLNAEVIACGASVEGSTGGATASAEAVACAGGGIACAAAPGFGVDISSACYEQVVLNDPFCCNGVWDSFCQNAYVACGGGAATPDVWYQFTGTGDLVTVTTCGSVIAAGLTVYEGVDCASALTCVTGLEGYEVCDFFSADDSAITFSSTVGVNYYFVVAGSAGSFVLDVTCTPIVEGCTNPVAYNYNAAASFDNGTCDFFSGTCVGAGTPVQLNMFDSFGDGWDNTIYTITNGAGDLIATGNIDGALYTEDENNFVGPEFGFDLICLQNGCYTITISDGFFPGEVSYDLVDELGNSLASGFGLGANSFTIGGAVCGCTDSGACNFDPAATDNDGSCEFITCAGCTDSAACNYDASATIDDASCCDDNCVTIQMSDLFGDTWNGANYQIFTIDGTLVATGALETAQVGDGFSTGTDVICLADGCYYISVPGGFFPGEVSWILFGINGAPLSGGGNAGLDGDLIFSVGAGACVVGCTEPVACNYDPAANINDCNICEYSSCLGCTYVGASNYDAAAGIDDGSCLFDLSNPCPADLNEDGIVNTTDLLLFLGAFGTICQ